jgi:CRP/FNR family transcriptional regulator, dissimilatory nitrate respiration regulator
MKHSRFLSEEEMTLLTTSPVFAGLGESELSGLLENSSFRINEFKKGALVANAGDEVHFQRIVISGSVKGEMVDFAGKTIKIEDIQPPRPVAAAFLFGNQNSYPVNIVANESTQILSIPKDSFLRMMQSNGRVLENFLHAVSSRGQFLSRKIRFLSFSTIKGKIAQFLLDLSSRQGSETLMLPMSQSQLSELFGVTRPSIGRAMGEMNRDGLISTEGKRVSILNKPGLLRLLK